ncbi:MAG: hypothetical protein M1822_009835 [Bathelium mastoideum]|nr:MAG: hypothetical protein M1822_009835 [Bathelium mastoideum]
MSAEPTFSTHDLRSHAMDFKREHEQKRKWAYGEYETSNGKRHPRRQSPQTVNAAIRRETGKHLASLSHRDKLARKQDLVVDEPQGTSSADSSADEDVIEASAAPEPDAGITYSYDAARGPSGGSQVLSEALARAVERFENHETARIVHEQYEVLDAEGEVVEEQQRGGKKGGAKAGKTAADEEEYEFV